MFISQPLAIVVIGGLVTSTLLTLVLVPVLYTLAEQARERARRRTPEHDEGGGPDRTAPFVCLRSGVALLEQDAATPRTTTTQSTSTP